MFHFTNDQFRHEQKYRVQFHEYHMIKTLIKPLMKKDPHTDTDGNYLIRSIYFDDYRNTAFYANEAGILPRKKYRIRLYNHDCDHIKLEEKIKVGDYITKNASPLTYEEFERLSVGDFDFLLDGDDLKKRLYVDMRDKFLRPRIIIDYDREAYYFPFGNVRITFDKYIRYQRFTQASDLINEHLNMRLLDVGNSHLVEIKYDNYIPTHLKEVMNEFGTNQISSSKFYMCTDALY